MHIHGGDIYNYQGGVENVLDFSANINPLGIPKNVIRAAAEGAAQSASYPDPHCRALRLALAQSEGADLRPENIICGNGAADLIFALALAQKPQKALLLAPGFHEYEQALRAVGCQIDYHFLQASAGFQPNIDELLRQVTPEVELLFFCNPNNPTGLALTRRELLPLLERCRQCGVLMVLDECFNAFLDEPADYTLKPLLAQYPNLFILKAFTKIYAMPGLRLGYGLCADCGLLTRLEEVSQPWRVSTPAQTAGLAALQETDYVSRAQALVKTERHFLRQGLMDLGWQVYNSQANYLFFQCPNQPDLAAACRARGVLLRDCSNYVGLTPGFYRIAVRTRAENEKLLAVLQQAGERRPNQCSH